MRISTSKSEAVVLSRKPVDCPLQVGNESVLGPDGYEIFGANDFIREKEYYNI